MGLDKQEVSPGKTQVEKKRWYTDVYSACNTHGTSLCVTNAYNDQDTVVVSHAEIWQLTSLRNMDDALSVVHIS